MNNKKYLAITIGMLTSSSAALAGTFGTDLNNNMLPATGGMGGASVARTVEPAAAVFGNPANLIEYNKGTSFTFGATFFDPHLTADHDDTTALRNTGTRWKGTSNADDYLVPTVAITHAINSKAVIGLGLTAQSGVGSDFRETSNSLNPTGELLVFNANVGLGYQVTDNLSLGATATIGNGYFQASLSDATGSAHGYGVRGTVGAKYDIGATSLGAYYKTPLNIEYKDYIDRGDGTFWSDDVEQPQEFAVGVANNSFMGGNLQLNADIIYKDWSSARFYKDFYRDQTVFALGAQLTTGDAQWRIGYSHARDPIKRNLPVNEVIGIGGNTKIKSAIGPVPVTGGIVEYFQATNAGAIWEDTVTAGFGYQLTTALKVDLHAAYTLKENQQIGSTKVEASAWQAGAGLTWHFE
ncbi:OmpP1/FadL family transporter [Methylophaga sulfidovorans]|uniref:Long-chain fatty acid transport protein n=1 Tax=Methylophaga sulfidovorans TaxID=45496 RepID=A0A1I3UEP0_9GAMM|nr:outer membrane protein transport protein [Methylophaga sulfidovorans]SFJ80261.1 long-chain fatty acid transport protein [Methylophaga sulfidovorans]